MLTPTNIALTILLINAWTFCVFGYDKLRAEAGVWRVSEASLLLLAFIGGSGGAYLGRAVFRHKTRKQPFCDLLRVIAVFQVAGLILAGGFFIAGGA